MGWRLTCHTGTSWPYCCEEVLLGLWPYCCGELHWPYCCEELHIWSLLKVNTCFTRGQVFEKQPIQVLGTLVFGSTCPSDGKNNWKIQHSLGLVAEEISVLFIIDTDCKLKKVNQC